MVGALPAVATETSWKLYDRDHDRPVARFAAGPQQLLCGSYGVFELEFGVAVSSGPTGSLVETRDEGHEVPPEYPLATSDAPAGRYQSTRGKKAAFRPVTTGDAPPPCDRGSCFSIPGRDPWVAVVDWDNWHGWSVGWTILQTSESQVGVSLLPLDDPMLAAHYGERITDLHLLAQLCHLSEMLEDPSISPPVAVNLSFGRPRGLQDAAAGSCDSSLLSCQISQVLAHLAARSLELAPERANPTTFFAAAGNHRKLLFPASDPGVTSVGALDLQRFHLQGQATPSWETPAEAEALFPGEGLCLEYPLTSGAAAWGVPPGSSYASALLSGWLAPSLPSQHLPAGRERWVPTRLCWGRVCRFEVTRGGRSYGRATSSAQSLVEGTASDRETSCTQAASDGEISLAGTLGAPRSLAALPALSFPEVSPTLHAPTPAPAPCVPCEERLNRGNGRNQKTVDLAGAGLGVAAGAARGPRETARLILGLAAGPAMDRSLVLDALYLRVETALYPIEVPLADLWRLESGAVDLLEIDLGSFNLPKRCQPSLVWVLHGPSAARGEVAMWTSTPILLRSK